MLGIHDKYVDPSLFSVEETSQVHHIWEIAPSLKCPVVGACLSIEEHRKILKKAGYRVKKARPWELHRDIMENLSCRNPVSEKVDSCLKKKYRDKTGCYRSIGEGEVVKAWHESFRDGDIDAFIYSVAMRNDLPDKVLMEIFGEAHMLSHTNSRDVMELRRLLKKEQGEKEGLRQEIKAEKARFREQKSRTRDLEKSVEAAGHRIRALEGSARRPAPLQGETAKLCEEIHDLRKQVAALKEENSHKEARARLAENEIKGLRIREFELQSLNESIVQEMGSLIRQLSSGPACPMQCDSACSEIGRCERNILIVGGITKMKHFYRDLVESMGHRFDYHDGYLKNGKDNLESRIKRSDLVLCPVNCNSHGACGSVKKLCNKHSIRVKMLAGSSLSALSQALQVDNQGAG